MKKSVEFSPKHNFSEECKDLITKLLIKYPPDRLGAINDAEEIKQHPWFKDFDFKKLVSNKLIAPFIPEITDNRDVSHFPDFSNENPTKPERFYIDDSVILEQHKDKFKDFDYKSQVEMIMASGLSNK